MNALQRCPSQIDLKQCRLGRDLLLAICHHTSLEGLRSALGLRRHLPALTNMAIQSTFAAVDLLVISHYAGNLTGNNLHDRIA